MARPCGRPEEGLREIQESEAPAFFRCHALRSAAFAISSDDVARARRSNSVQGDRTGACIAAAVIDDGAIATAYYCADPNSQRRTMSTRRSKSAL
jgi:hypothetical protein